MGTLRVAGLAWAASAVPEWGVRRSRRGVPLARPRAVASSLGAGQLRVGTEHGWLWDCRGGGARDYAKEMEVAVRVVQVACTLCQRVQDSLLRPGLDDDDAGGGRVHAKLDLSPVTVADWGVQATVSWLLSSSFHDENISIVAEEDYETLSSSDGATLLESVVEAVNGCLVEAPNYGLRSPEKELRAHDVIQAIRKCSSTGGPKGRFWVLDPVDGTLGFVRGDQYAIALALIEDGEVVLGVLGCPNYPMRNEWLNYHQKYYRLMSKVAPPLGSWHKGCVMYAQKGCGQPWMQPLVHDFGDAGVKSSSREICWCWSCLQIYLIVKYLAVFCLEFPFQKLFINVTPVFCYL